MRSAREYGEIQEEECLSVTEGRHRGQNGLQVRCVFGNSEWTVFLQKLPPREMSEDTFEMSVEHFR